MLTIIVLNVVMSTVIIKYTGKYYTIFKLGTHQPFVQEVTMCVCVFVCTGMCASLRLLITNGMICTPCDWVNLNNF